MGWNGDNKNLSAADCCREVWGKAECIREPPPRQIGRILSCLFNCPGQDLTPDPYLGRMSDRI